MTSPELEREALILFEAMLAVPDAEREGWLAARIAGRPALAERIEALREADRRAMLTTGAALDDLDEEPAPERIGAYRIVERIGRGGMGSVYLGQRVTGDFTHEAAIKIIKPGLLSEALVDRFRRERQTLAGLRHPNIAQLHDGGETEGGSPYIVMEYVDGLPLPGWIEARRPDRNERQRIFRDICRAVAFANRNLIVHRDLTPSNILVTADDTVKLIDFGIAKPVDAEVRNPGATRASIGSLSLTPGYAAPERMTSSEVTTAADIYSLGKILEKLLPPGPRDRELAAIVERATAADPARRYPTADALGDDVDAWHRSLPVRAVPQTRRYLAGKFVSRHRLGVAAAVLMFLLLGGGLATTLAANRTAELARADAERRFDQTRAIARALLFDAYDEVSRVPGSTRARTLLAHTGLSYIDALAADPAAPVDVKIEAAQGYIRLAQVTGGGQHAQLGRFTDGNTLLARADAIVRPLADRHADAPGVRTLRATLLAEQSGTNLYNNNDVALARRQAQAAQALIRPVALNDADGARLYALAIQAEGDSYLWNDELKPARATHLRAERFIAALPPALAGDSAVRSVRSANLRLLGEAQHRLGETAAARAVLDQAVAINRDLAREQPEDPAMQRKLAISLRYRAVVHRTNHRDELARQSIEEALAIATRLRDRDPNDIGALQMVALVGEVQAQILSDLGRTAESFRAGDAVIATHRRLVVLAGKAAGARRSMAQAMRIGGGDRYNGGDYAGACALWRESLSIFAALDKEGALTKGDRERAVAELTGYVRKSCEGVPHRGMPPV